jgi:hypothetical protein
VGDILGRQRAMSRKPDFEQRIAHLRNNAFRIHGGWTEREEARLRDEEQLSAEPATPHKRPGAPSVDWRLWSDALKRLTEGGADLGLALDVLSALAAKIEGVTPDYARRKLREA